LVVPLVAGACSSEPQPCLSVIPQELLMRRPEGWQGIWVPTSEATRLGLPPLGLRAQLTRGGFVVSPPTGERYALVSGPPGGPLGFRAVALRAGASTPAPGVTPEALLRSALEGATGLEPVIVGPEERAALDGRDLAAQSLRTGAGHAATDHCLVRVPQASGADAGMLLVFSVPADAAATPSCARVLSHAALEELVSTLRIDGG
jgi:hypothetical protein